ncbi:MAG: right-handed parallel beta-helix repeat-containing protein [Nitriliruptorales bacterium]
MIQDVVLDRDLFCPGQPAFRVEADNVVVDLGGHTIAGDGTSAGVDVSYGVESAHIRNGRISNFWAGAALYGTRSTITNIEFSDNHVGIENGGNGTRVSSSRFLRNFLGINMFDVPPYGGVIEDSIFEGQEGSAVSASQYDGVIVRNNRIAGNRVGLSLSMARRWDVVDNTFLRNGHGVELGNAESEGNRFRGNRFLENQVGLQIGEASVGDGQAHGFAVVPDTIVRGNQFMRNDAAGLLILLTVGEAQGSLVEENRFVRNGYAPGGVENLSTAPVDDGLHAEGPVTAGFTVRNNMFVANADYGVEAPEISDGGGNKGRANGNRGQCLGVSC